MHRKHFHCLIPWVLLSFLCALNLSCGERQGQQEQQVGEQQAEELTPLHHIKVDTDRDSAILSSSLFENVSYLPLETKEGALIGNVEKLLFDDSKIFILDKYSAQAVFIFDDKGKLLSKIDKRGQGPGEFIGIRMLH